MKQLLIVRHAKSSWDIGTLNDFERPLNDRGKKDAPEMAQRLIDKKINIDAFVSSPAKRAKKTCELFCSVYKQKEEDIIFVSALYHADVATFYQAIETIDDSFNTVAIFSHNPGITQFVNELVESVHIDNMPTCGIFSIKINADKWKDFKKSKKEFLFFDYPKAV
ncbi:SixA phosphatase family protein [Ferruginibacter albus]|uniref:SixA phosphatase family protein n=1 Tax=Ferruginibacter albus TaxID=2875540 RepID=UPI001CC6EFA7|nr:histidine phosphatase family protein [Ferruginibacter albus]UAY52044.1 histidine phosphatase family protein [Ferruginibacter albus]